MRTFDKVDPRKDWRGPSRKDIRADGTSIYRPGGALSMWNQITLRGALKGGISPPPKMCLLALSAVRALTD